MKHWRKSSGRSGHKRSFPLSKTKERISRPKSHSSHWEREKIVDLVSIGRLASLPAGAPVPSLFLERKPVWCSEVTWAPSPVVHLPLPRRHLEQYLCSLPSMDLISDSPDLGAAHVPGDLEGLESPELEGLELLLARWRLHLGQVFLVTPGVPQLQQCLPSGFPDLSPVPWLGLAVNF